MPTITLSKYASCSSHHRAIAKAYVSSIRLSRATAVVHSFSLFPYFLFGEAASLSSCVCRSPSSDQRAVILLVYSSWRSLGKSHRSGILAWNGEIHGVLSDLQGAMMDTICSKRDFQWTEADYRDKLNRTFLQNPGPSKESATSID